MQPRRCIRGGAARRSWVPPAAIARKEETPLGVWGLDLTGATDAADRAVKLGALSWLVAVLNGCVDWCATMGDERLIGFVYMCLNCVGMMFHGQRRLGVGLSTIGLATTLLASWISTDLVVEYRIGIEPTPFAGRPPRNRQEMTR